MADPRNVPDTTEEPIESRRAKSGTTDPEQPLAPGDEGVPAPDLPEFGEFAAESARPSPLDDIADAEREKMPRD